MLLRLNRRYYDGDNSYIKNIFDASKLDDIPTYFTRLIILRWLQTQNKLSGSSSRQKGYFRVGMMKDALISFGINEIVLMRELIYLIKAQCIASEDLNLNNDDLVLNDEFLIKLEAAGYVHLELLRNVTYLAGVSEDIIFTDKALAQNILQKISQPLSDHYAKETVYENAKTLVGFLEAKLDEVKANVSSFNESEYFNELCDISLAQEGITSFEVNILDSQWVHIGKKAKEKASLAGVITNHDIRYGLFVELEDLNITGLVHKSVLPHDYLTLEKFQKEEKINVVIDTVDPIRKRVSLHLERGVGSEQLAIEY